MRELLKKTILAEDGATTVDWVVLTAGVVSLNIVVVISLLESGINSGASNLYSSLTSPLD